MNKQNTNIKKKIPNTKHLLAQRPWEVHLLASAKMSLFQVCSPMATPTYCGFQNHRMKDQIVSKQHKGTIVIFILVRNF